MSEQRLINVGSIVKMNPFKMEHIELYGCDVFEGESEVVEKRHIGDNMRYHIKDSNWWFGDDLFLKGVDYD